MSQFSETALSDIIPDVEHFIKENDIEEQMDLMLAGGKSLNLSMTTSQGKLLEAEDDYLSYSEAPTQELSLQDHDYKLPTEQLLHYNYNHLEEMNYIPPLKYPPDESPALEIDEYPGRNDFEVLVIPNGQKTPWEYSAKLNKIFIAMGLQFPVAYSLKNRMNFPLFVRATPVYSQPHHFRDLVHRCIGHEHAIDPSNSSIDKHIHQHIMRCENRTAIYCGNKYQNKRLSVIVPLNNPQAGADTVKEYYSFVCKNSCTPGGMNRRPIQIIFTLENEAGDVLGRRVLSVRICSCPKRDKEKEEKEEIPPGKKRKRDPEEHTKVPADNKLYPVNFNIVGKDNYKKVLEISRALIADEIVSSENKNSNSLHKKCYKELTDLISKAPE